MTRAEYIEREISRLKEKLQLQQWEIRWTMSKDRNPDDQAIEVKDWGLKKAHVYLTARGPRKRLTTDIEHELSHLVLWPENKVFDSVVNHHIPQGKARTNYFHLYNMAQNEVIGHIQRIMQALDGEERHAE